MTTRPNFLVFITDQHRADWLGCTGHPVVKTPNIDRLAERGQVIRNACVAAPVCMPNRASLMTGRMPSVHGLRSNGCALSHRATTFVDVLAAAGYDTALIGKSHLQPFTGLGPIRRDDPADRLIEEALAPDPGDYGCEEPDRYLGPDPYEIPLPYYGFQHVDMVTGHGDLCGGHYQQWFRRTHPDWEALEDPANAIPHNFTCPQAHRTPIPPESYPTAWIADRAIDYLGARGEDPFFAFVAFPDPHHPFNPPGPYWDMYDPDDFAVDVPFEAHENPPPPLQWLDDSYRSGGGQLTKQTALRVSDRDAQEAMALTAGMITMIDDQIGRVMAALEASGQADNTVVVFTSDHGDYMGDFGLLLKGMMPFRGISDVPLIWSDPDGGRGDSDALVSTIDLSATILDRAGVPPYHGIQGRSFLPALADGRPHREALLMEFNDGAARFGFAEPARVRTLRSLNWRLTLYGDQPWGELYDLAADTKETRNLWEDPDHAETRAALTLQLAHELTRQMDESPRPTRLA